METTWNKLQFLTLTKLKQRSVQFVLFEHHKLTFNVLLRQQYNSPAIVAMFVVDKHDIEPLPFCRFIRCETRSSCAYVCRSMLCYAMQCLPSSLWLVPLTTDPFNSSPTMVRTNEILWWDPMFASRVFWWSLALTMRLFSFCSDLRVVALLSPSLMCNSDYPCKFRIQKDTYGHS